MKKLIVGVLLLAASLPGLSRAELESPERPCFRAERVFDPALSAEAVAPEMEKLRAAGDAGDAYAAYLLGTLYRLGPAHPASRLPLDPQAARVWLRRAALDGNLGAMSALAELELATGHAMEAMVLAQAVVHYDAKHPRGEQATLRRYQAGLVARAFEDLGRAPSATDDPEILGAFRQFVAENGAKIDAGIRRRISGPKDFACPPFHDNERWPLQYKGRYYVMTPARSGKKLSTPGVAVFHLVVGANGRVDQALLIDSLPGPEAGAALRPLAEDMRFNRIRGAPPRAALAPVTQ
ncbi:hypothetical protein [Arenimonas terrae]|jgi:hypothetical protein|uniref:Sel1 repeat family protein n=1 Tax=Arenimonas terrae TaxID=2546226 RepID=A0A5C4RX12_9GAMM|nr:hypothetical protein [Arenimonas terrae]TNJ35281.1 hypothetical protein E1B00_05860 [Arenimonas terrae]